MRSSTATGKRKKAKGPSKGQTRRSQAAAGREKGTRRKRASAKAGPRGFASMSAARQRAIARMGGEAAHREGTAHEFSPREAREAGRKGGVAVSRDRQHMARIGRKGGEH